MEEMDEITRCIPNYESLKKEQRDMALEKIYKRQCKSKVINRTLAEIIENQVELKGEI